MKKDERKTHSKNVMLGIFFIGKKTVKMLITYSFT